jgi:hypothetical protein
MQYQIGNIQHRIPKTTLGINLVVGNYLLQIPLKTWAKYAIPNSYFNQITSNIAKSINST